MTASAVVSRNPRAIELRQLRFFVRVVDIGSITRAASALHIAQPALSKQLADLEYAVGVPLLVRSARGIQPTEQGRALHVAVQRILRDLDAVVDEVGAMGQAPVGTVRLGCLETIARQVAYPLTLAVLQRHPGVKLVIVTGQGRDLYRRLLAGDIDLAFLSPDDEVTGVQARGLVDEEIVIAAASTAAASLPGFTRPDANAGTRPRKISGKGGGKGGGEIPEISLATLRRLPFVLPSKSTYSIWHVLKHAFGARPFEPGAVMEADSLALAKRLVLDGHGCGLLPWSGIQEEVDAGTMQVRRVEATPLWRRINLCRRPDMAATAACEVVGEEVVATLERLVQSGAWRHVRSLPDTGWR